MNGIVLGKKEEMKKDRMSFMPPDGLQIPEGEESFSSEATFKVNPDGSLSILEIGGLPLAPIEKEMDTEKEAERNALMDAAKKADEEEYV